MEISVVKTKVDKATNQIYFITHKPFGEVVKVLVATAWPCKFVLMDSGFVFVRPHSSTRPFAYGYIHLHESSMWCSKNKENNKLLLDRMTYEVALHAMKLKQYSDKMNSGNKLIASIELERLKAKFNKEQADVYSSVGLSYELSEVMDTIDIYGYNPE